MFSNMVFCFCSILASQNPFLYKFFKTFCLFYVIICSQSKERSQLLLLREEKEKWKKKNMLSISSK